jgi:hypothetical protein
MSSRARDKTSRRDPQARLSEICAIPYLPTCPPAHLPTCLSFECGDEPLHLRPLRRGRRQTRQQRHRMFMRRRPLAQSRVGASDDETCLMKICVAGERTLEPKRRFVQPPCVKRDESLVGGNDRVARFNPIGLCE